MRPMVALPCPHKNAGASRVLSWFRADWHVDGEAVARAALYSNVPIRAGDVARGIVEEVNVFMNTGLPCGALLDD